MPDMNGKNNPAYKHGYASRGRRPTAYYKWQRMLARCYHPSQKDFARYGAQGVTVCDRWRFGEGGVTGFECFIADMGFAPFDGASIDRIDNSKGYSPDNCRWATAQQQANNRRSNRHLTIDGETKTVAEWARVSGVGPKTILYRLKQGVPIRDAVFTAPDRGRTFRKD